MKSPAKQATVACCPFVFLAARSPTEALGQAWAKAAGLSNPDQPRIDDFVEDVIEGFGHVPVRVGTAHLAKVADVPDMVTLPGPGRRTPSASADPDQLQPLIRRTPSATVLVPFQLAAPETAITPASPSSNPELLSTLYNRFLNRCSASQAEFRSLGGELCCGTVHPLSIVTPYAAIHQVFMENRSLGKKGRWCFFLLMINSNKSHVSKGSKVRLRGVRYYVGA